MQNFDISLIENLKGKRIKGTGFEIYDSKAKKGNNNGIFDEDEILKIQDDFEIAMLRNNDSSEDALSSILNGDKDSIFRANSTIQGIRYNKISKKMRIDQNAIPIDNTRSNTKNIAIPKQTSRKSIKQFVPRNGRTAYLKEFNNYKPKNEQEYNTVLNYIKKYTKSSKKGNIEPERAKAIANMVCSLSENYGIPPIIVVNILAHETGGFNFNKISLGETPQKGQKPEDIIYKGVMQVSLETIECLYGFSLNDKHPDSAHNDKVMYDHEHHYLEDESRVRELRKKYRTPKALFDAISKDVSLGLEVGIMIYKGNLVRKKGNTRAALRGYNGGNYTFDSKGIPAKIPINKCKKVN